MDRIWNEKCLWRTGREGLVKVMKGVELRGGNTKDYKTTDRRY